MAEAHAEGDRGLKIAELFAIGWPEEKASSVSVEERVRAVVKRLRRAGLGDLLEAHAGGFRLSKAARVGHAPR
jgi:chromosome condensin MukBEF MukE localization factor